MSSVFWITSELLTQVHDDLSRLHPFALERVTFLSCRTETLNGKEIGLLADSLHVVADEDYEHSTTMGALIGGAAFRKVLQYCYAHDVSMFHVHRHEHRGRPVFSRIDIQENTKFVPDFFKVRPNQPHGALVLSHDSMFGLIWKSRAMKPERISKFVIAGRRAVEINYEHIR